MECLLCVECPLYVELYVECLLYVERLLYVELYVECLLVRGCEEWRCGSSPARVRGLVVRQNHAD